MGHTSATRTPSWRILMASSWHTAWGCISVSCWHLISLTAKMFYVLAKHLGPERKREFYAPHDNLAAAAATAVLHFVFPPVALVYICPFFFSFLFSFFFDFFGRVKVKNGNKYTKRKMQQYRCKFYMHTSHLCRECVEICYFKCWRPKGARLDGFCGGILGDRGMLGGPWVTG